MRWRTLVVAVLLLAPATTVAWDTKENHQTGWWGAYLDMVGGINEHTTLSHLALSMMGVDEFVVRAGSDNVLEVTDWNASWFRPNLLGADARGDDPVTVVEERAVPAPAHVAGMPDYSWTIYDWVNKHSLCPTVPEGMVNHPVYDALAADPCHAFRGWLGALNANHFGTQARLTYERSHATAMGLAQRAREMREMLEARPGEYEEYRAFVLEAELEAYMYEGYAQHYLQDRWSSGHMWQRWNASDYESLPDTRHIPNFIVAAFSGIVHGAEGVTTQPDPLCSPTIQDGIIIPMSYVQPGGTPADCIGDYRLTENITGTGGSPFGFGTFDGYTYDVRPQLDGMLECSMRGWAEVIRAIGQRDDGTWGAWGIELTDAAPPASARVDAAECWFQWATNASMLAGFHSDVLNLATLARLALELAGAIVDVGDTGDWRPDTVELYWSLWRWNRDDPNGTQAAEGAIPGILQADPGNYYGVASWLEPRDITTLPEVDEVHGRDRRAMFGFFNRAHADHFCDHGLYTGTIEPLRGSQDPMEQAFCRYFAERAYRGTRPDYTGENVEERATNAVLDAEAPVPIRPICERYGLVEASDDSDALPYFVHSGYVSEPGTRTASVAPGGGVTGYGYATVANWCDRVPVVDVGLEDDVAATVRYDDAAATLTGLNFGSAVGAVTIFIDGPLDLPVRSWANTAIEVELPGDLSGGPADLPDGSTLAPIVITTGGTPSRDSVGLAYLRILPWSRKAPIVTNIDFASTPLVPGDPVRLDVDVTDPEGVVDLGGTTTVTVTSGVLDGGAHVFTAADGAVVGGDTSRFGGNVTIERPLNDRSSCVPADWEASAVATDDAAYRPEDAPDAHTGPTHAQRFAVANVAPTPACDHDDDTEIRVAPGETFVLRFAVADDNNDGVAGCDELPAGRVRVESAPAALETDPATEAAAFTVDSTDFTAGTTRFESETITVELPHPDNDDPDDAPHELTYGARDDAGLGLGGANRDCPGATPQPVALVRVENRPPVVVSGRSSHEAVHPEVTTEIVVTVEVDDPNTYADVSTVVVDLSALGGPAEGALNRTPDTAMWVGTFAVHPPGERGVRNAGVVATDDDGDASAPFDIPIEIGNLPPVWLGGGFSSSIDPGVPPDEWPPEGYRLYECDPVRIGTIWTDPNRDMLAVTCIIEGEGTRTELPMAQSPGTNVWIVDTTAPAAGDYTVSFEATEVGAPPPPLTTLEECCPMQVLPRDGCEPRVCVGDGTAVRLASVGRQATVSPDGYVAYVGGSTGETGTRTIVVADACSSATWELDLPSGAFVAGRPRIGGGVVYWADDRGGRNDYRLWSWDFLGDGEPARVLASETVQIDPRLSDGVLAWVEEESGVGWTIYGMEVDDGVAHVLSDAPLPEFVDVRFDTGGGRVVWLDDDETVFVAQAPGWTASVVALDRPPGYTIGLSVSGATLVFDDFDDETSRFEVFVADTDTGAVARVPVGASGRTRPDVFGPLVVFEELIGMFGPDQKIVLFDPEGDPVSTDLSDGTAAARDPAIDGRFVVWTEEGGGVWATILPE